MGHLLLCSAYDKRSSILADAGSLDFATNITLSESGSLQKSTTFCQTSIDSEAWWAVAMEPVDIAFFPSTRWRSARRRWDTRASADSGIWLLTRSSSVMGQAMDEPERTAR
jgi:hypothetical protein